MHEYIEVLTAGGPIDVSLTLMEANGELDPDEIETTGDAINTIIKLIAEGTALTRTNGEKVLIRERAVLALTYRREEN